MAERLDRSKVSGLLKAFDLKTLFIEELGWDRGGEDLNITVNGRTFTLKAVAQKRRMAVYEYAAGAGDDFPDHPLRQKIQKHAAKNVHENIIIYAAHDKSAQYWQWVKREQGRPDRTRQHIHQRDQSGESLIQKLENIVFSLDEEEDLSIVDVSGRVRAAFDVENVTKQFYTRFQKEHAVFLSFIKGFQAAADKEWYASLMLNRMMFIYFIQKRGFLDGDPDYLRSRLERMRQDQGKDKFQTFYRLFLLRLFHEGLAQPEAERTPELAKMLGKVPYLNGGLFEVHDLERDNTGINIPDEAFGKIFDFFDAYDWHLDDRPLRNDKEINPDVLGYIFEKYINQKQMGAYYTKEDITGYISRSTIIPHLFNEAQKGCAVAFAPGGGVWRLLSDDPDRYFYEAALHGVKQEIPADIAAGIDDVSKRGGWNKAAPESHALKTETWREYIARRGRYQEIKGNIEAGEVASINDFVTYNLDMEKFIQDVIAGSEGPELVRAFWKALNKISVLDPTCGSGAFLFAALNILEPIYTACLESMRGFVDDLDRSGRKHHLQTMKDFRDALAQVERHASENYFILKTIIVSNLYGVDIMEEAVEICKLRLFLKLAAQVETYDQIEPLPDIDFNIRPGNTLVGFTSLAQIENALNGDILKKEDLPGIEERAQETDRAFNKFREMQAEHGMDAAEFTAAKAELRNRLNALRARLDACLAGEYGVKPQNEKSYQKWRSSHQPFHWFVEFYGIITDGGFDVVIGNPPYLEIRQIVYSIKFLETKDSGAVHAMCVERSLDLCKKAGYASMIVPLALVSTQRMTALQHIMEKSRDCWYANFAWRPGKLFEQVNRALTIFVIGKADEAPVTYSTGYLKWRSDNRKHLLPNLGYSECPRERNAFWVPKFSAPSEVAILQKCLSISTVMANFMGKSKNAVYYRTTGGLYWKVFTNFSPKFYVNGKPSKSSRETTFTLRDKNHVGSSVAVLSSNTFWWWYTITSNLRDMNPSDLQDFPISESALSDPSIAKLGASYIADLKANSTMLVRQQKTTGKTETQSFEIRKSKPVIDRIDKAMAKHYGFSDEEVDFLINYDIKFRTSSDED